MHLRFLILLVGMTLNGWAQCPTHVLGTQKYPGKIGVSVAGGQEQIFTGEDKVPLKICQGQMINIFDYSAVGSQTVPYFTYKSDTFDLRGANPPGSLPQTGYKYDTPGTYALIVIGPDNTHGGYYACKPVEVLANPEPEFKVAVCTPGVADLYLPKNAVNVYDIFFIDWGDGSVERVGKGSLPVSRKHTYAARPSSGQITVSGTYNDGTCGQKTASYILPAPGGTNPGVTGPPSITQLVLTGPGTASLQFVGPQGVEQEVYQKELAGGTYTATGVLSSDQTSSVTLTGLDNTKQYCFVVQAKTLCSTPIQSAEICSVPLAVSSNNKKNTLTWKAYPAGGGFESYTVTNGGNNIPPITAIGTTTYTDTSVTCGTEYCYRVTAKVGAMTSLSQEICVPGNTGNQQPEAVKSSFVSVVNGKVQYDWELPAGERSRLVQISRADNGGGFSQIEDNFTRQPYLDSTAETGTRSYCYQMVYRNQCGNTSAVSGSVCTIYLRQSGSALTWTASSPFTDNIDRYIVQALDGSGTVIFAQDVALGRQVDLSALGTTLPPGTRFRVEATSVTGQVSWSNIIDLKEIMKVYVPDAFTPNGDNTHDLFVPKVQNVTQLKLTIFDSWGNPIYVSQAFDVSSQSLQDGWNGRVNGKDAPQGNYAYRLDVQSASGESFTKRGVFRLIR